MKKISISIIIIVTIVLLFWFTIGRTLLGIYSLELIFKDRATRPYINTNELKDDLDIVINIINKESSDSFSVHDEPIEHVHVNDIRSGHELNLNERELKAFINVCYGIEEKRRYDVTVDWIHKKENGEIEFLNEYGYEIRYIPNDNKDTLKELENELKNNYREGYYVIKLEEHFYQIWHG